MSFSNIRYYKHFIDLLELKYKDNRNSLSEGEIRNLFSRGYYTIFLRCRDTLSINVTINSSHDNIIKAIPNRFTKNTLTKLKKFRKEADYEEPDFLSNNSEILSLFRNINLILSFSKEQLESIR
jgi:uncharacterized protein (UPF0332 family)